MFSDYLDVMISKIILKNKKIYYFNTFPNKKQHNLKQLLRCIWAEQSLASS